MDTGEKPRSKLHGAMIPGGKRWAPATVPPSLALLLGQVKIKQQGRAKTVSSLFRNERLYSPDLLGHTQALFVESAACGPSISRKLEEVNDLIEFYFFPCLLLYYMEFGSKPTFNRNRSWSANILWKRSLNPRKVAIPKARNFPVFWQTASNTLFGLGLSVCQTENCKTQSPKIFYTFNIKDFKQFFSNTHSRKNTYFLHKTNK